MWGFAPGILGFLALYGGSARAPLRVAVRAGIGVPFKGFGKRFCEKFVIRFYTVVSGFRKVFRVLYGCEETLDTNPNRRADSLQVSSSSLTGSASRQQLDWAGLEDENLGGTGLLQYRSPNN